VQIAELYTLLLDPPLAVPSRANPSEIRPLPEGDVRPAPSESLAVPPPMATPSAAAPAAAAPSYAPGESYGPVNSGDSLWKIASRSIPDSSVNINQMMIAIQRANPDAFVGGNINRLRTGAVLRIPSREEISAVGASEASQIVREQTSTDTPLQPIETDSSAPARPTPAAPERSADSRLAIVPPRGDQPAAAAQSGAAAAGEGRELRADLARAREQTETLDQENRELKSRVQELEKIRGDSERLLELRSSELQALQQRLAELEAERAAAAANAASTPTPPPATPTTEAAPAAAPAEQPITDPVATESGEVPDLDAAAAAPTTAEAPAEAAPADVDEPAPAAPIDTQPATEPAAAAETQAETAPAEPMPARPPRQEWYENPLVLGGGGALLLGLLALLGLRGRGKKKAAAAAAAGTSSRFEGTDFGVPGGADSAAEGAEAFDDAEERELLDRVAEQPDDLERHIDLVRYYYGLNDPARFEGAVEAMYAQVYDPDDIAWQQALQMGREMPTRPSGDQARTGARLPRHGRRRGCARHARGSDREGNRPARSSAKRLLDDIR
jgi:pilus assembly protein FimV